MWIPHSLDPGLSAPSNATLEKRKWRSWKESTKRLHLAVLHLTSPRMFKFTTIHIYLYIYTHTYTLQVILKAIPSFLLLSCPQPTLPSQISFKPIPWLGQNSTFTLSLTLQSNSSRQSLVCPQTVALEATAFGSCPIACLLRPWYTFSQQWKQISSIEIQAVRTLVHLNINCFFTFFKSSICLEFLDQLFQI